MDRYSFPASNFHRLLSASLLAHSAFREPIFHRDCVASGAALEPDNPIDERSHHVCRADPRDDDCREKPIKLYVTAVKSGADAQERYDKVVAVISERNWTLAGKALPAAARERVHGGSNDLNNISTEIAMRIVGAAWLPGEAKR